MTEPADITDDLQRILALAKRAINARDDAAAWARAPERQAGHHGACCDALWDELHRLVQIHDGIIPAIEHPAARERRIAQQIRHIVVATVLNQVSEAMDEVIDGTFAWDEPGAITKLETEDLL